MKLSDIKSKNQLIEESIMDGFSPNYEKFKELSKLNTGYGQILRLANVFETGDWGALINNPGRLNLKDIGLIKIELHDIIFDNPLLVGYKLGANADGYEKMRLLGNALKHGIEMTLSAALTTVFGAITAGSVSSGVFSWTAPLAGVATIGAAAMTGRQLDYIEGIIAADHLLNIIDAYDNIGNYDTIKRGRIRRFLDWVQSKSPEDIKREMQVRARIAAASAQAKFDHLIQRMPPTITYYDDQNNAHEYPVVKLFEIP